MQKLNAKGQNVIEYLLAFAAVVVVLIAFLAPHGQFANMINDSLNRSVAGFETVADSINFSNAIDMPPVGDDGGGIIIPPEPCGPNPC